MSRLFGNHIRPILPQETKPAAPPDESATDALIAGRSALGDLVIKAELTVAGSQASAAALAAFQLRR